MNATKFPKCINMFRRKQSNSDRVDLDDRPQNGVDRNLASSSVIYYPKPPVKCWLWWIGGYYYLGTSFHHGYILYLCPWLQAASLGDCIKWLNGVNTEKEFHTVHPVCWGVFTYDKLSLYLLIYVYLPNFSKLLKQHRRCQAVHSESSCLNLLWGRQ